MVALKELMYFNTQLPKQSYHLNACVGEQKLPY